MDTPIIANPLAIQPGADTTDWKTLFETEQKEHRQTKKLLKKIEAELETKDSKIQEISLIVNKIPPALVWKSEIKNILDRKD